LDRTDDFQKFWWIRTASDSILSDQDWTPTEKFHSPLIADLLGLCSVANLTFSREFGLVFCRVASFFEDLRECGLLVFIEICLFFGLVFSDICFVDCFFSNFMALFVSNYW